MIGLRKKGKEGCDILQSSQEQKDSCKTNAYWHENMFEVLYICVSCWLLAHESRDISQAETKKILFQAQNGQV